MLSIKPQWLQKILDGSKTIELRKSRPDLTPPFKVHFYCTGKGTKDPHEILEVHSGGKIHRVNGLVAGECICDRIDRIVLVGATGSYAPTRYQIADYQGHYAPADKLFEDACLTEKQVTEYLSGRVGYGWHISGVKVYDVPKTLGCFGLNFAPQSWRYLIQL